MIPIAKLIAGCLGIGYIQKGAGTLAALFYCLLWWWMGIGFTTAIVQLTIISLLFFSGVWSASLVEKEWGHDSARVVIDEVLGMAITLFLIPMSWVYLLIGFFLFRFFDILKPFGIKRMEKFTAGWGVMMDDVLAGVYALMLVTLLRLLKPEIII